MFLFLSRNKYAQGVVFLLLMITVGCVIDVIAKYIGQRLHPVEIIFFRFFFGLVSLLPFVFRYGAKVFKTSYPMHNLIRGVLGVVSFYLYTRSLLYLQLVEVVTILWSIPLFVVVFAFLFLNECVTPFRWIATLAGFAGLSIISTCRNGAHFSFQIAYIFPIAAAMLFAAQDVLIKKMLKTEKRITMLLYYSIVTTALTFFPALCVWMKPTLFELTMLMLCGLLSNVMQYFIFKAFDAADLSALAPFRYIEFFISALMGFIFFAEVPGANVVVGASVLIFCTLYLVYSENRKIMKKKPV